MEVCSNIHAAAALPPGKEPPLPIGFGGWVDSRTSLDAVAKRENHPYVCQESDPDRQTRILSYPGWYIIINIFKILYLMSVGLLQPKVRVIAILQFTTSRRWDDF
jgi:hypothetical protein